jgi:hypothetical protein
MGGNKDMMAEINAKILRVIEMTCLRTKLANMTSVTSLLRMR